MKGKIPVLTVILAFFATICCANLMAKSVQQTSQVTLTIPEIISLSINNGNVSENPTEDQVLAAYENGLYEFVTHPEAIMRSNTAWQLSVEVTNIDVPVGVTKIASDFMLKHDQADFSLYGFYGSFKALSGYDIIAGDTSRLTRTVFTIDYAMIINPELDIPGEYKFTLLYNLSTPA